MFFNSIILGTIITISSYSWFRIWIGLEINLLSVIPLFINKKNILSSESSLKYFITQAIASLILLIAVIILLLTNEFINPLINFYFTIIINSALFTKLGAAPFHFWFPEVIEGLRWTNRIILLTWQKIAPIIILITNKINRVIITTVIILSLIIRTIRGFNQIRIRKILAFSSINHIAWILSTLIVSLPLWIIYFTVYSIINFNIITVFEITKSFYINQIINIINHEKLVKFTFITNFLSLGGLPPFLGFIPKWLTINWLTSNGFRLIAFVIISTTLIILFIYIRVTISSLILASTETKTKLILIWKMPLVMINTITLTSLIFCTIMINFI